MVSADSHREPWAGSRELQRLSEDVRPQTLGRTEQLRSQFNSQSEPGCRLLQHPSGCSSFMIQPFWFPTSFVPLPSWLYLVLLLSLPFAPPPPWLRVLLWTPLDVSDSALPFFYSNNLSPLPYPYLGAVMSFPS